jgi:hypothetical protein
VNDAPRPPEDDEQDGPLSFEESPEGRRGNAAGNAALRNANLDEAELGPRDPDAPVTPGPPAQTITSRYGWIVGLAVLLWLVYIGLNTLRTDAPGSHGVPAGDRLPPFAAPLATSDLNGDANLAEHANQGQAGKRPACAVRGPKIVNTCQLLERGPLVVGFYASRAGKACGKELDTLERARSRFPDVSFIAVAIRGDRGDLKRKIAARGWGFPVAYDRDGAIANRYGIAGCPTTTFAYQGGLVESTKLGTLDDAGVAQRIELLRKGPPRRSVTSTTAVQVR